MAIDLLNRMMQAQVSGTSSKKITETLKNADSAEAARILKTVLSLRPGDSLQGELVSANGKEISLLLGDTVLLSARMEKDLQLAPGQKMSFMVDSNQNGKLSLKPLFANTGMEQNAMKALDAAGIPITDKTLALTEEMMRQGMPVNKQNIAAAYRHMGMYPDAPVADLVMLQKMDIPVTADTLSQMYLYQTNQQYLFADLQGLSAKMTDFLMEMAQSVPTDTMQDFIREFLSVFIKNPMPGFDADPESIFTDTQNISAEAGETAAKEAEVVVLTENGKTIITENKPENVLSPSSLVAETKEEAEISLKEAELLRLLKGDGTKTEHIKDTLGQNIFALLKEQFLMKPEEMQSAEYVKNFYERLHEQMNKLQGVLKNAGKEESTLFKEAGNVKNNIQFMNQINQMYHYVQLPLKMNEGNANGDLYVFKRKRAKIGDDGKLTALLHLSMPVLGNMDIFLSLEEEKLSTRFCMEKEELIDFIQEHIEQLNERLMKRGYQVLTTVTAAAGQEEKSVIEEIMTTEHAIPIMTSQSFDARC